MALTAYIGAEIHDGVQLHRGKALVLDGETFVEIAGLSDLPAKCRRQELKGGYLVPGFVDLQVNGGGGVMFNVEQSVATLETMSAALRSVGTRAFLPTLITDTPDRTRAAIAAASAAIGRKVPGVIGIHLEGPHLSIARKGAHDPELIRPMSEEDLNVAAGAAGELPNVLLTVAPENVTREQVVRLTRAGVSVSLGHTDADYDTCMDYASAGAVCSTHLFNAMSQLGNREPGLVGATLDSPGLSAGLIADGIHVHPAAIRAALRAKQAPGQIFLVSDAMATAGSDITEFDLNGRKIYRRDGMLTLADGTLAGADLDFPTAIRFMVNRVGVDAQTAIAMSTSIPADLLSDPCGYGRLCVGQAANLVYLDMLFAKADLA